MGFFSNKEEYATELIYTNDEFPLRYQIKQNISLLIKDEIFNETSADIIWKIGNWEKNDKGYIISIISEEHNTKTSSPQMKEVIGFINKFNIPVSNLLIQLDERGYPKEILNQSEIYNKWLSLRNRELSELINDEATKNIILSGDKDFEETLPIILKSLLYILFLPPVYGNKFSSNSKFNKIRQKSILFQENEIKANICEKIISISNIKLGLEHTGIGDIENYGKIEKIYKDTYKKIVDIPFNYRYNYKANYLYNTNGKLLRCDAEINERANINVVSKQNYQITLLK